MSQEITPTGEMKRETIRQNRGPAIKFTGRELASAEFTTKGREPLSWVLEIWETAGGAMIAVSSSTPAEWDGAPDVRATVVEPGEEQAMQFAVMDHFGWTTRAKTMVRDQLGWKLVLEVQ